MLKIEKNIYIYQFIVTRIIMMRKKCKKNNIFSDKKFSCFFLGFSFFYVNIK